tara:strand:+ start:210 stop:1556 length:1347 start_codon:yes stop_codon:yes gene_type:complete
MAEMTEKERLEEERFQAMMAGLPEGNQQPSMREPVARSASRTETAFRPIQQQEEDSFFNKAGRFARGFAAGSVGQGQEYIESLADKRKQKEFKLLQATALDARSIQDAIQSENMPKAVDILVDRMNLLEQMGEDTSDTKMLRDALVSGRPDIVMGEINTFLSSLPKQTIDPKMLTDQGQMVTQRLGGAPTAQTVGGYQPAESYRAMTDQERTSFGIPTGVPSRMNVQTGKPETMGGGGININTSPNTPAFSDQMQQQAMEGFIPTRESLNEQRMAITTFGKVEQMANSLNAQDMSGAERIVRSMFPDLSISMADPNGIQAVADSLRTQVAPQMRVAGSGSTSDIEFKAYLGSLPSLLQSMEGRQILVESFRPAAERAKQKIELARQFAIGEMSFQQYLDADLQLDEGNLYSDAQKRKINRISGQVIFDLGAPVFTPPSDGSITPAGTE